MGQRTKHIFDIVRTLETSPKNCSQRSTAGSTGWFYGAFIALQLANQTCQTFFHKIQKQSL